MLVSSLLMELVRNLQFRRRKGASIEAKDRSEWRKGVSWGIYLGGNRRSHGLAQPLHISEWCSRHNDGAAADDDGWDACAPAHTLMCINGLSSTLVAPCLLALSGGSSVELICLPAITTNHRIRMTNSKGGSGKTIAYCFNHRAFSQ